MRNWLIFYIFLFPIISWAQLPKQKIKYASAKTWLRVSSEHVDIAYSNENKDFAIRTAKYVELAWREVSKSLDFEPKERYLIYLYPSPAEYAQEYEEHFPTFYKNLNYFYLHKSVFSIYYNGTQKEFYKHIKTQLCKAFLSEMFYKNRASSAFQANLLVYLPDWYITGLSSFIGEGWDAQDEAILRGFNPNLIEKANQGFDLANHQVLKKSIWHFIASEYSPEKIAEILYMSRLTRTADGGFVTVLGSSMYRLTQNWLKFIQSRMTKPEENTQILTFSKQEILQAATVLDKIAAITYKEGKLFLVVAQLPDQSIIYKKHLGGYVTDELWLKTVPKPICWSENGATLAFVLPNKGKSELFIYQEKTKELSRQKIENHLDLIHSMSFTSSGKLLLSAAQSGQTDLFLLTLGNEKAQQLTHNLYDEIYPLEINSTYYYSAAYPFYSNEFQPDSLDPEAIKRYYSLYSFKENQTITLELQEHQANVYPIRKNQTWIPLSDKTGTLQMMDTEKYPFYTNQGLNGLQWNKDQLLFSQYKNGKKQWIFTSKIQDSTIVFENKSALEYIYGLKLRDKEIRRMADSLEQVRIEKLKNLDSLEEESQDSISRTTRVRYYVFDDEDSIKTVQKTPRKRKKNRTLEHIKIPDFDIKQVKIKGFENDTWTPLLLKVGTYFVLDPLFRLGIKNELCITDARSMHDFRLGFTPYMDFRTSNMYIRWKYTWDRLNLGAELDKTSLFFKKPQRIRYNVLSFTARVGLTLSTFEQLSLESKTASIKRTDLALTDARVFDGNAATQEFFLRYTLNKVKRYENYNRSGHSLQVSFSSHSLLDKINEPLFFRLEVDARKYVYVGAGITWATRFSAGVNMGSQRPKYFIGGTENWINSTIDNKSNFPIEAAVPDFYFSKIALPLRGFSYNARNGSQYGVINSELRIPFGSLSHKQLRARSLYNFRWILFADIGTAWTTGNPFSQRNPIDANVIYRPPLTITVQSLKNPFIIGFGTGLQFYLSGYPIRVDVAFPIEDQTITGTKIGFSIGYDF